MLHKIKKEEWASLDSSFQPSRVQKIEKENEVQIKLRVENKGHLPKLDGRRDQEHLGTIGIFSVIGFERRVWMHAALTELTHVW